MMLSGRIPCGLALMAYLLLLTPPPLGVVYDVMCGCGVVWCGVVPLAPAQSMPTVM